LLSIIGLLCFQGVIGFLYGQEALAHFNEQAIHEDAQQPVLLYVVAEPWGEEERSEEEGGHWHSAELADFSKHHLLLSASYLALPSPDKNFGIVGSGPSRCALFCSFLI
jgi:hypothetical protein